MPEKQYAQRRTSEIEFSSLQAASCYFPSRCRRALTCDGVSWVRPRDYHCLFCCNIDYYYAYIAVFLAILQTVRCGGNSLSDSGCGKEAEVSLACVRVGLTWRAGRVVADLDASGAARISAKFVDKCGHVVGVASRDVAKAREFITSKMAATPVSVSDVGDGDVPQGCVIAYDGCVTCEMCTTWRCRWLSLFVSVLNAVKRQRW